jgi:hypothetical protein
MTAKRYNTDDRVGPFATFVECFLKLIGAVDETGKGVSVVNLLNEMAEDNKREKGRNTGWTRALQPSFTDHWLDGLEEGLCSVSLELSSSQPPI